MNNHTPGPWKACRSHEEFDGDMYLIDDDERASYDDKPFIRIVSERHTIATAHDLFEFKPENAKLIAIAPDMYELLSEMNDPRITKLFERLK